MIVRDLITEKSIKADSNYDALIQLKNDLETIDVVDLRDDLTRHTAESVTQGNPHGIDAKANKTQPAWIAATLENGWVGNIVYRKNEFGNIEIRGALTTVGTNTGGTVILTLPVGYNVLNIKVVHAKKGNVHPYNSEHWFTMDVDRKLKIDGGQTLPAVGTTSAAININEII